MYRKCVKVLLVVTIAACASEADDWTEASDANTIRSYEEYVERHPDGPHRAEAASRLQQLRDERDFQGAARQQTEEAWASFLEQHPDSPLVPRAREGLAELKAWLACASSEDPSEIRKYLSAHPTGLFAADAKSRLAELDDLDAARRSDTIAAYEEFRSKHPSARSLEEVGERVQALEHADREYGALGGTTDRDKLTAYAKKFDGTGYAKLARDRIEAHVRAERRGIGLWQDPVWASAVKHAPACRIRLRTNERGKQVVSSIGGGYWAMKLAFALGANGRFDGRVRKVPQKRTLFGNGSRWVLVGTNRFYRGSEPSYAIEADPEYPALMAWDAKGGLMYIAGRVVVRPATGDPVKLGHAHSAPAMLRLLSSREPVIREAGAWAASWLAKGSEARRNVVDALLPLLDDPDPLVRVTVVEAIGRAGDAPNLPRLKRMRDSLPKKPTMHKGRVPEDTAEAELRGTVEWAILTIEGRVAGRRVDGVCGKCLTPGCTVHAK